MKEIHMHILFLAFCILIGTGYSVYAQQQYGSYVEAFTAAGIQTNSKKTAAVVQAPSKKGK